MLSQKQARKQKKEDEQEFNLINPDAERPQGAIFDKDFEPKDPGWPYPDIDWGFEDNLTFIQEPSDNNDW